MRTGSKNSYGSKLESNHFFSGPTCCHKSLVQTHFCEMLVTNGKKLLLCNAMPTIDDILKEWRLHWKNKRTKNLIAKTTFL